MVRRTDVKRKHFPGVRVVSNRAFRVGPAGPRGRNLPRGTTGVVAHVALKGNALSVKLDGGGFFVGGDTTDWDVVKR